MTPIRPTRNYKNTLPYIYLVVITKPLIDLSVAPVTTIMII